MRHKVFDRKLGRTFEHRNAMLKNLATSLFKNERIVTTLPKAKLLRRRAERLITWAKRGNLSGIRLIERFIKDKDILKKLINNIAPRFKERNGGYTRVLRLKDRKGDAALLAIIELVVREKRVKKEKKGKKEEAKK
ncbi:MAG: 50S ribosomal protein L17 [Candidatus Firestonebacteria bacterium]